MARKKDILRKIRILMTQQFDSPQAAFDFFNKKKDAGLSRSEIKEMLKSADINKFLSGPVSRVMLKDLDKNNDDLVSWKEFRRSIRDLMNMDDLA